MKRKDNKIDFSVIVLCYNPNYQLLLNTIASVLNQKEVTFELLICDDGSKDDYEQKLKKDVSLICNDVTVKYIFNKKNEGTIKNYLAGIKISVGEYIKPISPGDYLYDEFTLKKYRDAFISTNCSIVFSDAIYYSGGHILERRQYPANTLLFNQKYLKEMYCKYGYFFLGATLCSKNEIVSKYLTRVKDTVLYLEDYSMMMMALLENERVVGIEEPLIWYEYGEGISTNKSGNSRIAADSERVHQYLLNNYGDSKVLKDALQIRKIKENSFCAKVMLMLIKFPKYYYYKLGENFGCKQKKYATSIEKLNKTISTGKGR